MKIEAAGKAIDVDDFACEVEAGDEAALHGAEIDLLEGNTSAGDEFVFVDAFTADPDMAGM